MENLRICNFQVISFNIKGMAHTVTTIVLVFSDTKPFKISLLKEEVENHLKIDNIYKFYVFIHEPNSCVTSYPWTKYLGTTVPPLPWNEVRDGWTLRDYKGEDPHPTFYCLVQLKQ